ncbi:MAG TPA: nucleotidyltransferase substrate binding protein [Candidatus Dormibacteraeota bacterium]|nr:nucleotidyltransferase substrate binding protein [Candidatus Dormibacteraeota bacterium]
MDNSPDIRWRQRLQSFRKAFGQLSKAAATANERALSDLEKQGLIKAFEFTHELAWKVIKDFLESRGTVGLYGSRDATREGFAKGLIEDGDVWMEMIQNRNRTSHTYNQETADEIAEAVTSSYVPGFEKFLKKFTELEKQEA